LNTGTFDPYNLVAVASNQFTVSADCWVEWSAPGVACDRTQTRLFNVTDSVAVGYGIPCSQSVSGQVNFVSSGGHLSCPARLIGSNSASFLPAAPTASAMLAIFGGTKVFTRVVFWRTA
jgi:hypothetical protein